LLLDTSDGPIVFPHPEHLAQPAIGTFRASRECDLIYLPRSAIIADTAIRLMLKDPGLQLAPEKLPEHSEQLPDGKVDTR